MRATGKKSRNSWMSLAAGSSVRVNSPDRLGIFEAATVAPQLLCTLFTR
jgi:hypothetical protein